MAERTRALRVTKEIAPTDDLSSDRTPANGRGDPVRRSRRRSGEGDDSVTASADEGSRGRRRRRSPAANGRSRRPAEEGAPDESAESETASVESTGAETEATAPETPTEDHGSDAATSSEPKPPASEFASKLSDRAIQRITGGNAFLRGRIYARRNAVEDLRVDGDNASAAIHVRNAEEPYRPQFRLDEEGKVISACTCPGWRGPSNHCKHVAALLVALRDRERPPRPRPDGQARKDKDKKGAVPVHVPQTVSVGGKRRRSRRRRRGATGDGQAIDVLSARELTGGQAQDRGQLDTWLPSEVLPKPYDFEYRLAVRSASIAVTPVLAGSRTAVPITEALGAFNMVSAEERPLFRALGRHTARGKPATAELRGEDAAELFSSLAARRVLLEPNSMELRFFEEPLKPSIELDLAGSESVRVRVVFEANTSSGSRRIPLSNGAWFEGTPGWHIDVVDGVARPVVEAVTPAWLQRLYRSPALVHPLSDLPRLLTEFIPKVATSIGADLPDLSSVADLVDAHPHFQLKANGDIVTAEVRIKVAYADQEFDVPVDGFPSPLAFLPPTGRSARPRVVRRDVGAEMAAVQQLLNLGFEVDESQEALRATGDTAVDFWSEGIGTLPETWDRFIPNDLVDVTIRNETVTPQMRVSSGVDWLSLDMTFDAGGVAVDENELRIALEKNRRLVRLEDGTYAPIEQDEVADVMGRLAEILATSGDKKKLPLSQAGRIQDLMGVVGKSAATPKTRSLFDKLENVGEIELITKPRTVKAKLRDYQKLGFSWLVFIHNLGSGGVLADDMGLGKTIQTIALLAWAKAKSKSKSPSLVVAPTSVVPNWEREIQKFAPSLKTLVWQGPNRHAQKDEVPDVDVLITSYALMRRDEELFQEQKFLYAILDEAQHIKNPMSATARAAKKLPAERRLALTGTPIENRLSEFWSIVDFVSPGLLGDLKTFEGEGLEADRPRR